MALSAVVFELAAVVGTMLVTTTLVVVGPRRFLGALGDLRWRLESILVPVLALCAVLLVRMATQDVALRLSKRVIGYRMSALIYRLETALFGVNPVTLLQSFRSEPLTDLFVFVYIYGYVFLIVFPFVAYLSLDRMDHLRTLLVAYTANYGIGLVVYVLFVVFGPRNYDPLLFENLLYEAYPQARLLTDRVNDYTNTFPSLHTSLSMTTLFMAWLTRDKYPIWLPIAAFFAVGVTVSTMYLAIHWFSDVVAGTLLALFSVYVGREYSIEAGVRSVREFLRARRSAWGPDRD